MQKALERSNPHRRHIAELSSDINVDYINRIKKNEPIHFGDHKKELNQKYEGGAIVKPTNYQGDVIRAFSNKNGMPKPDMHFVPDTLAVGKSIRYNARLPKAVTSEYKALKEMGNMELNEDIAQVRDLRPDDWDIIKDMPLKELEKYLKKKEGAKKRAEADLHKGVQQKRIKRRVKAIEANEPEPFYNLDYGLGNLFNEPEIKKTNKNKIEGLIKDIKKKTNKKKGKSDKIKSLINNIEMETLINKIKDKKKKKK